jgi:hypothetical protein
LKALYEGKTVKEFLENYKQPGERERLEISFKQLLKEKEDRNKKL